MTPRHFLDINAIAPDDLRRIVDAAHQMKCAGKRVPENLRPSDIENDIQEVRDDFDALDCARVLAA